MSLRGRRRVCAPPARLRSDMLPKIVDPIFPKPYMVRERGRGGAEAKRARGRDQKRWQML